MHGVGDVPARMHSARLTHGKLQAFCGSTQSEVEAGTRTVKGLDLSKGPKLQPHSISCWRLEDCNRGKKRAACVMQVRQDFAIMRFCTPRLVCQGPYCTWKIYVCSAFHVPAESCKIVRLFVLWWSSILRHSLLVRCWRPIIHYPTVLHDIKMGYNWSVWWEEAFRMCDAGVPRLCHHAFLHTTALMSGPLLHMKNICLLRRMSSGFRKTKPLSLVYASLQKKSSYDDVILFCAILRQSGAGGLYIWPIYNISWVVPYFQ